MRNIPEKAVETALDAWFRDDDEPWRGSKWEAKWRKDMRHTLAEAIAPYELALRTIRVFPITHPTENQDAANMAMIARDALGEED